jgi:hypothetical protein
MPLVNVVLVEGLHQGAGTRDGRPAHRRDGRLLADATGSRRPYVTMNATEVSGAGIIDQKRMHATRTFQWPGLPSRTEASPGWPVLGWARARAGWCG